MPAAGNNTGAGGPKNVAKATKPRVVKKKPTVVKAVPDAAQAYVSQGQAVEKAANQQNRAVRVRQAQVKDTKAAGDVGRAAAYVAGQNKDAKFFSLKTGKQIANPAPGVGVQDQVNAASDLTLGDIPGRRERQAAVLAPGLKVLDQTTRPVHALAGGARAVIKGQPALPAIVRGAKLKDRYLFGDALRAAGVHGPAASVLGFGLDVVADPTTYTTLGAGSVASHLAEKAAANTLTKAVKGGMTAEGAQTLARGAAKRAEAAAPAGKGLTVKFAGHELPGVRRGSAAVARAIKAPVRKVAPAASKAVPAKARAAAREVRPLVRPAGVSEAEFQGTRQAARVARATVNNAEAKAQQLARHLHKNLPAEHYQAVIDAIERNDLSKLPDGLAGPAHDLRSALRGAYRQGRRAGAVKGKVGDGSEFLRSGDLKRLRRTVNTAPASKQREVVSAARKAAKFQGRAEVEQRDLEARLARQQRIRDKVDARRAGRGQKPLVRKPLPVPEATGRLPKTLAGLERKRADVQFAEQRVKAAKNIPTKGLVETHEQYLQRLVAYANQHGLDQLGRRATKLLESKPSDIAKGYFPRDFDQRVLKQLGLEDTAGATTATVRSGPSRTVSKITSGYKRANQQMLSTVNPARVEAGQVPFSTNVPLVALNQLKQSARATSQGTYAKQVAQLGRPVKDASELKPGEGLYKLGYKGGQFGLHEVQGVAKKPTKGGQYVALDRDLQETMKGATQQVRAGTQAGRVLDKTTGRWKRLATATPGFHIRNIIGDTQQAYLAQPGQQLPRNIAQAGKAVRRANQQAKSLRVPATDKTIKVAGKRQPLDDFLKGARENGVLDAGYIGRELRDLTGDASGKVGKVRKGTGQTIERWMANRENLMRLATYKAGLDRGMTAAAAADHANLFHVDYGELSDLERKALRRAFPFYTWTARTLPVTAKTLVTKPGKFANLEKAREETGAAFTGETEQQQRSRMTLQQQRQLPFVIKGPNGISASLPATLLNELPTGASSKDINAYLTELGKFSFQMLNPLAKVPIELQTGVSTFTKRPIEDPKRPLVAAPAWVAHLPDSVKKKLEVTPNYIDKRTGKKTWGWRGKADYWSHQVPGAPQQVSTLASGGRPGQPTSPAAALAGALGIRVDSLGPQAKAHAQDTQTFQKLAALNRRAGELNQQGINSSNATPEYRRLRQQINALTKQVSGGKPTVRKKSGDILSTGGGGHDILSDGSSQVDILK